MAENNVCKTIMQEYMLPITIQNVKCPVTCECGRVVLSRKSVYFGISKHILYFHIVFMSHTLYFLPCTFSLHFPCFALLLLIALETLLVKRLSFVFTKDRPSVIQTYMQRLNMKSNIP